MARGKSRSDKANREQLAFKSGGEVRAIFKLILTTGQYCCGAVRIRRLCWAESRQTGLLDGHIRMFALQELGFTDAPCLIAPDDESYTDNNRIRLSTIQEHFMIRRAVDRGVTQVRLAKSLELDFEHIT